MGPTHCLHPSDVGANRTVPVARKAPPVSTRLLELSLYLSCVARNSELHWCACPKGCLSIPSGRKAAFRHRGCPVITVYRALTNEPLTSPLCITILRNFASLNDVNHIDNGCKCSNQETLSVVAQHRVRSVASYPCPDSRGSGLRASRRDSYCEEASPTRHSLRRRWASAAPLLHRPRPGDCCLR